MKRFMLVLGAVALFASSALADVTVTQVVTMTAGPMTIDSSAVTLAKGTKLRIDTKAVNQEVTLLGDAAAKQIWMVNHTARQLEPFNPQQMAGAMAIDLGEVKMSVTPNGQTKDVLGRICQGYTVEMSVPMTVGGETVQLKIFGPAWLAKDGPGIAEMLAYQKSFSDMGMSLSPLGQGPQGKALIEASKGLLAAGVMLEQQMTITMEGTGQVAQAMGQMGGMTMTTRVTNISVDTIPDEKFAIPEGYTKK